MDTSPDPALEALVAAFYAAFDNRDGRTPDGQALLAMFEPTATITRVDANHVEVFSPASFASPRVAMLTDGSLTDFHEWEVEARSVVLNAIASRWSTYEKAGRLNGAPYHGRGDKFIQFVRRDGCWRIASILWQDQPG